MTARMVRASKSRFFVGLAVLLLTIGFVAIFHSSQQQLDEMRQMEIRCEQQQESLNSQILIIEKSLKSERYDHQQTKTELIRKSKDAKEFQEKTMVESNMKFGSLQQHYKLLKNQHDDFVEECANNKTKCTKEYNGLKDKLKRVTMELNEEIRKKDKEIDSLKIQLKRLQNDKDILILQGNGAADGEEVNKLKYKNYRLEKQIDLYNEHCTWRPDDAIDSFDLQKQQDLIAQQHVKEIDKNFKAQIPVSENLYRIPITIVNHTASSNRMSDTGVGSKRHENGGIINSVENFQIIPKPIIEMNKDVVDIPPKNADERKSSTAINAAKSSVSNNGEMKMPNAPIPTATVGNKLKTSSTTETNKFPVKTKTKPIPEGVVPVPEMVNFMLNKNDELNDKESQNDRYSNVMEEIGLKRSSDKGINDAVVNEADNGAHEVLDNNDFLVDDRNHKDHLQEVLEDKNLNMNNAAEDDTNNSFDKGLSLGKMNGDADLIVHKDSKSNQNSKLLNELDADQGKVAEYHDDDLHLEQAEEEGDDDEYRNPQAMKQDPAVRN
ncbi:Golgi integral membrane protein 4 [Pseudolycoriella hygida]|uniref:Golgi integral membrane protein 4 n=1 Tax=Pseudolycoriella hygida TaxID=35572 RepID=A0A9Q0RX71_9DIPT|nr:Golgi integral membrane protein 4 [Pseudolycoriella hygida]